ncbi:hypothetical protein [Mesorhizobium sp. ANAO-SY3R2]|uniref:hypothetical protein n=1 Tax=Mesorhizobium sp. ANAO-SY3R2 TaxID=3166644 RepID=UPI003672685B
MSFLKVAKIMLTCVELNCKKHAYLSLTPTWRKSMPNTRVRAAAEGMPVISRRNLMRASAGAVAAVIAAPSAAVAAVPSPIDELGATLRAARAAHRMLEARFVALVADDADFDMPEIDSVSDAEWYAFHAVLDYRPRDLEEVHKKLGLLVDYAGDGYGRERIEECAVEILRSLALGGDGRP